MLGSTSQKTTVIPRSEARALLPLEEQGFYELRKGGDSRSEPVSVAVNSMGTGRVSDDKLTSLVRKHFDLSPRGIIDTLKLRRPIYRATAAYGHFGRPDFSWERTNMARTLARSV